jgi:hypothetical protein
MAGRRGCVRLMLGGSCQGGVVVRAVDAGVAWLCAGGGWLAGWRGCVRGGLMAGSGCGILGRNGR